MADQTDTLSRLNEEKDYEDRLAQNLSSYFLNSLDYIAGLSPAEKALAKESLTIIMQESFRHSHMFNMLVQWVVENGENNY